MTIKEKVTDLRLSTIKGVTAAIEQMLKDKHDKPSPLMTSTFEAVLDLLDQRGRNSPNIAVVVDKVRESLHIPRKTTDEKQQIDQSSMLHNIDGRKDRVDVSASDSQSNVMRG